MLTAVDGHHHQTQRELAGREPEQTHRHRPQHEPDDQDGGGQRGHRHQSERHRQGRQPVGDQPVDEQRGDAPAHPGKGPGTGLRQTEPLARIVIGCFGPWLPDPVGGPDSQDPIARAILSG